MFYIGLIFLFYCFLKLFYYGIFEIQEMKNKIGGIFICLLAGISFIMPATIICYFYIL